MADLSNFKRGQIVGARIAGSIATNATELFSVATCTVSKWMTAFEKGKNSSENKSESCQIGPSNSYVDY